MRLFVPRIGFYLATGLKLEYQSLDLDLVPSVSVAFDGLHITNPARDTNGLVLSAAKLTARANKADGGWTLASLDGQELVINPLALDADDHKTPKAEVDSAEAPFTLPAVGPITLQDVTVLGARSEEGVTSRSTLSELRIVPVTGGYAVNGSGLHDAVPVSVSAKLLQRDQRIELLVSELSIAGNTLDATAQVDFGSVPRTLVFSVESDQFEWTSRAATSDNWSAHAKLGTDAYLPLHYLREWDVKGRVALGRLAYDDLTVTNIALPVDLTDGVLFVGPMTSELLGGHARVAAKVDYGSGSRARWQLGVHAENLFWSRWPVVSSIGFESLAPSEVLLDLEGFGRSSSEMLATTNGHFQALLGESQVDGQYIDAIGGDLLLLLYRFMSAGQRENDNISEIQCGSAHLVFEDGALDADRKIIVQTPRVNLFFNSEIDLHREKLTFNVSPQARGGVGVNLNKYFSTVQLAGNLTGLRPNIDAKGSVALAAELWAGALSGGASGVALGVFNAIRNFGKSCEKILPRIAEPGEWFAEPS